LKPFDGISVFILKIIADLLIITIHILQIAVSFEARDIYAKDNPSEDELE